ncbi:MOSC domain-containing protein [Hyphomicrobium sulfonivorans]|uniref:MOSC domain-containing protein n=1 Tax=Hyphomicrobium sulfonivorans TaxID=121290 RepID=UPI00156FD6D0|nr:MOSC domain-containing protein [Hyphomicrobium sulfonivorans]MBI1649279.1 MOSC domain-containing protein [Hyphomicrobium sulfonivorans]NSL73328.1 MOSC domain-containing protein [Hyphomicrobium sulfonivorans]
MNIPNTPAVVGLYRYPVKGLSPEALPEMALVPGGTAPFDRVYAIENGPGRFDPEQPAHLPKTNFLMLMRNERLATLVTRFDETDHSLTIFRAGKQVARGNLATPLGRRMIEQFFAAYMQADLRGPPRIVFAPGHSFSDVAAKCLHIVNLASVRELERIIGRPVDPLRFRPNIIIDGAEPWSEFGWIGKQLIIGDVRFEPFKRTQRCAATDVDPGSGQRDMAIPATLRRTFGHTDFGIYARVTDGGTIKAGDPLSL